MKKTDVLSVHRPFVKALADAFRKAKEEYAASFIEGFGYGVEAAIEQGLTLDDDDAGYANLAFTDLAERGFCNSVSFNRGGGFCKGFCAGVIQYLYVLKDERERYGE